MKFPKDIPWVSTGKTIGEGGQSTVQEVEPKEQSEFKMRKYALKILRKPRSVQAMARFQREIQAIKSLEDPRIVKIFDCSRETADFVYYVMPEYDADPLDKIAFSASSPFKADARRCLEFIVNCAEALQIAHDEKIVHRDLKPGNILVDRETGNPIIIDFGCCLIEGGEAITLTDEGVGSKNYMAPECEAGAPESAGASADIYSLGKVLWAIVTGQHAFAREEPAYTNKNLKSVLPNHPDCWHLTRILAQSIRKKPEDRFSQARKMAQKAIVVSRSFVDRYPPLEHVGLQCPACGCHRQERPKQLGEFRLVFKHPIPRGVSIRECSRCGFIHAFNEDLLKKTLSDISEFS